MDITDVVKVVMEQIKETVRSETVIGAPVQAEESVIIPVSRITFGFGAGGGNNDENAHKSGMGTGGGASVEPVAFVVVSKGKAQILPIKSREATLTRLIDLLPSFLDLIKSLCSKDKEKEKEQEKSKDKSQENK
ncbi:MAG TPA: spore germination protein GerW family protein [Anaerolineae bacterium]|nr:spore germination protein GerW family protein [Anaerolineae bacterium]